MIGCIHNENIDHLMRTITTKIQINATAEQVWDILTDLPAYSNWNPFIPEAKGSATEGSQLEITITPPQGNAMQFKPRVLRSRKHQEFRWVGSLFFNWLFQGEHIFQIYETGPDAITFEHSEHFSGILVPFLWKNLKTNISLGFEAMNAALKERAEQSVDAAVA